MHKITYLADEETGEVFDYQENPAYEKLWNPNLPGGMIKYRNYHRKNYSDRRLSTVIKNDADLLRTFMLTEMIVKNTNRIGRTDGKGFAGVAEIQAIIGLSEKKTREYLGRVIRAGILAKLTAETGTEKVTSYAFNPVYVNSCKYVPLELYAVFRKDIDPVIPVWMKERYDAAMRQQKGGKSSEKAEGSDGDQHHGKTESVYRVGSL